MTQALHHNNLTHPIDNNTFTMPSHLRLQSSFEPFEADAHYQTSPTLPPAKKQKMSLTRTYAVASTARSKLGREASRADHDLRLLVGHANLLDTLMVELADAEREQEAWFNQSVRQASKKTDEPRHIQWIDTIEEDLEDDSDSDDESEADSDIYDEDAELYNIPLRKMRSPPLVIESAAIEDSDEEEEFIAEYDEEDDSEHALTRVPSQHSPPELMLEDDSESEDDSMPPSPEAPTFELTEKQQQAIDSTAFFDNKTPSIESYVLQQPQHTLIAAC